MNIKEIVDNFSALEDWEDRYRYLIGLGDALPPMAEDLKMEENRVKGCMSQVWMTLRWDQNGKLSLLADSDARIVRGLVAILYSLFGGKGPEEIRHININQVFGQLGLDQHLSPNRRNGFYAMVERIRAFVDSLPMQ